MTLRATSPRSGSDSGPPAALYERVRASIQATPASTIRTRTRIVLALASSLLVAAVVLGVASEVVYQRQAVGLEVEAQSAPHLLFVLLALLSNLVSNVPAVMLLLPLAEHPGAGPVLALASTLAGNLLIVGSIATIIVIDAAARRGIEIGWRQHARVGVPVTIATLAIAAGWLALLHA